MSKPVILLLAYHFPPAKAIGGARPHRFYKYMKRRGYDCHVVTASSQQVDVPADDIHFVPDPLRVRPKQGMAWQAERIGWKFLVRGDLALGWSDAAYRIGAALLQQFRGRDVTIISSAPPLGTHLAAWRLASQSGRKWIADFRDPLVSPAGERAVFPKVAGVLEQRILKAADLVLANTDSMRDSWVAKYTDPEKRIHVLWNGFDTEDGIQSVPVPFRERRILSHVGELYGGRDVRPILLAFDRLMRNGLVDPASVRIRQVGAAEPSELPGREFVERAEAAGWLELRPPVSPAQAKALQSESDGLLLIQPHTGVQVPGKLFEYLRMGRSILGFVVKDSPVERILSKAGIPYCCVYPEHRPEEMDARILEYLSTLGQGPYQPSPWFTATFEASRQAEELDRLIRTMY
jgi:glycosyltransferase involved in cell wall biosynthesis